jgi:preprotein translocase subunit SecG
MLILLLVLILIACAVLIMIVLAQNPKGGGLSSAFGGGMASNVMGVKQTTNFLEKTTWIVAVGIMVLVIFTNFFLPQRGGTGQQDQSRLKDEIENMQPGSGRTPLPQQQGGQQQGGQPSQNGQQGEGGQQGLPQSPQGQQPEGN